MQKSTDEFASIITLPFIWALVWAVPGGVIELLSNLGAELAFASNVDMWPQTLALPGFVAGLVFFALIAAAGRTSTFMSWPLGTSAGLGALAGSATWGIILALGYIGGSTMELAFTTVMGAAAAVTSTLIFRRLRYGHVRATAMPGGASAAGGK